MSLPDCLSCALVLEALRILRAPTVAGEDARTAGWRLAVVIVPLGRSSWQDRYTDAAAHGLALALDTGDTAEATRWALWIVRPADAMDTALRAVQHQTVAPARVRAVAADRVDLARLGVEAPWPAATRRVG